MNIKPLAEADPADQQAWDAWHKNLAELSERLSHLIERTPYGFARYGGKLRRLINPDHLDALMVELKADQEAWA